MSDEAIEEEKTHALIELRSDLDKLSSGGNFCEAKMHNDVLLKEGLKKWKDQVMIASVEASEVNSEDWS